jgi:integrase
MKAWDRGDDDVKAEWRPLKRFRRSLKSSAKLAGVERPHRYHDVRARYGTFLAKHLSGRALQDAMRHQDFETTQKYIDSAELDVMHAVDAAMANRPIIQVVTVPAGEQKVKAFRNKGSTESQTLSRKQKKSRPIRTG